MPDHSDTNSVTELLQAWSLGDKGALDRLLPLIHDDLRTLARRRLQSLAPGASMQATALVNEAWLKLAGSPPLVSVSRVHFKRIAARAMRQVLIEAARRRNAQKRGGGLTPVTFDEALDQTASGADDLLALDAALEELARIHPRQALMVESRFFGGLDISETAELLGVSEATILRDWRAAKAWLAHELRRDR